MERHICAKGQATRARLLETAMHLFAEKGYQQTKVSDIVKAAGLTQAAFYLYFPSKEAIFTDLVNEFREHIQALSNTFKIVTQLTPEQVPGQVVKNLKGIFQYLSSNLELTKIAWFISPNAEEIKSEMIQLITANLQRSQAAGHLCKHVHPGFVAEAIIGVVDRLTSKWLLTCEKTPDELAEKMAEFVMYGISAYSSKLPPE